MLRKSSKHIIPNGGKTLWLLWYNPQTLTLNKSKILKQWIDESTCKSSNIKNLLTRNHLRFFPFAQPNNSRITCWTFQVAMKDTRQTHSDTSFDWLTWLTSTKNPPTQDLRRDSQVSTNKKNRPQKKTAYWNKLNFHCHVSLQDKHVRKHLETQTMHGAICFLKGEHRKQYIDWRHLHCIPSSKPSRGSRSFKLTWVLWLIDPQIGAWIWNMTHFPIQIENVVLLFCHKKIQ